MFNNKSMKNKIIAKIKKNFTKKDATYLIVIGVLSGLFIGSLINDGPRSHGGFEFKGDHNISFKHERSGHQKNSGENFFWHDENMGQNNVPSPTPSTSTSPSISPSPSV